MMNEEKERHAPDVPFIAHESAMARQERTIRRLWILAVIMFAALIASNGFWITRVLVF